MQRVGDLRARADDAYLGGFAFGSVGEFAPCAPEGRELAGEPGAGWFVKGALRLLELVGLRTRGTETGVLRAVLRVQVGVADPHVRRDAHAGAELPALAVGRRERGDPHRFVGLQ